MTMRCIVTPPLWIDESLMNLCEFLDLQPKDVNVLSFLVLINGPVPRGMTAVLPSPLWVAGQARDGGFPTPRFWIKSRMTMLCIATRPL